MKSIYHHHTIIFICICFLSIGACHTFEQPKSANSYQSNAALINSYWKLIEVNQYKITLHEGQKEAFIQLRQDNKMRGFTSCNHITGLYLNDSNYKLSFNQIKITEKACPYSIAQERQIVSMLTQVHAYKIKGDNLSLYNKKHDLIAKLAAIYF